ncbi:MAG: sugar phosphate isomerase/epimerase family protein [Phycisphaeraceae bacterium]
MQIGCFALIDPFTDIDHQFARIREMGFDYADLTDNHDGATLGTEYGFAASLSLDSRPGKIRDLADRHKLTLTAVCAHANLLDPPAPDRYGTHEIIKATRLAHLLGIKQVVTAEGDAKTDFGHNLSKQEAIFAVREKLYEPTRWAEELGVEILIEPHGWLTDPVENMQELLDALGHEDTIGINLDTGNCWLGGEDPHRFVQHFGKRIKHVHWKDMPADMESQRGKIFGCGMATIALGDGVVGIETLVQELKDVGFDGPTTLEIAGEESVKTSAERLTQWGA